MRPGARIGGWRRRPAAAARCPAHRCPPLIACAPGGRRHHQRHHTGGRDAGGGGAVPGAQPAPHHYHPVRGWVGAAAGCCSAPRQPSLAACPAPGCLAPAAPACTVCTTAHPAACPHHTTSQSQLPHPPHRAAPRRRGYVRALEDAVAVVDEVSFPIDTNDRSQMLNIVNSCIGTKFTQRFGSLIAVRAGGGAAGGRGRVCGCPVGVQWAGGRAAAGRQAWPGRPPRVTGALCPPPPSRIWRWTRCRRC